MSCTRSSPSCESRSRLTASYSYRPCCALVVDLMCHSRIGTPIDLATSSASIVLPVPGSPFTSSGRCSVIAALTASVRSSVETYDGEPLKRMKQSPGERGHSNRAHDVKSRPVYKSPRLGQRPAARLPHSQTPLRCQRRGDHPPGRRMRPTWPPPPGQCSPRTLRKRQPCSR